MKYIFTAVLWILITQTVSADTFNIIVSGKPGGTFYTRAMLMHDFLVDQGHDVNLINGGNIAKSEQLYKTMDEPVIMPWMDSANVDKANIEPNQQTFGILEYKAPVLFCSIKYNDFTPDTIKIGYSASWPKKLFNELQIVLEKPVKFIPYQNSGDLVLSLNSNEVDYIAISITQLKKLPEGSCFAVTNSQTVNGIEPLKTLVKNYKFSDISQHAYWLINNYNEPDQIRKILDNAVSSAEYNEWLGNLQVVKNKLDVMSDLKSSVNGAYVWGRTYD